MQNRLRILPLILCAASFVVAAQVQAQVMKTEPASASANANAQAHTQAELHAEVQAIASPPPENEGDADSAGSISGRFQLHAPKSDWATLLREHIPELSGHADPQNITPALIRKLRLDISNILATEGYFSPVIQFNNPNINPATSDATAAVANLKAIVIEVDPGPRTIIENVSIQMHGPLADRIAAGDALAIQRRKAMQEDWGLAVGQVFRDSDWSDAKNQLIENLRADGYAAASISESHARIDAEHHRGILQVDIDSGPMFTLGELQVTGLQRYPAWLLQRYRPPSKGEPYSRGRLLEFQRLLQNSPYFASVAVSVDPDPAKSDAVPIDVHVVERKARDLSFGLGYSSNTGF
ncbi:MAG: hypothetical protein KGM99_10605, partial [Burkholderiales bacterium]|nr:hypothetical protein [Burkholderiales bacterium]